MNECMKSIRVRSSVNKGITRRQLLRGAACTIAGVVVSKLPDSSAAPGQSVELAGETLAFVRRCARADGGYDPSPDPAYEGNSDTKLSDLAAVTYAAILAKTMGWQLPHPERSIDFIQRRQQSDGAFIHLTGKMDSKSDAALLYNTVQGVVALRAHQVRNQTEDGYLGDHVASAFHMAHYFRLVGQPTPKAKQMVARVLRDQKPDGGWNIKEPSWDVHACFDAVFILRQLGGDSEPTRRAIEKAADWVLTCRSADGGFGHYPKWHSDMDAVYFQFGTLIQAGRVPSAKRDLVDAHTMSWGHAMQPGNIY